MSEFLDSEILLSLLRNVSHDVVLCQVGGSNFIQTICDDFHARNRAAGWWTDLKTNTPKARNTGELLMLAVSELAEIPSSSIYTLMDDKLPERCMFEVELGDFLIRCFDIVGGKCETISDIFPFCIENHQFDTAFNKEVVDETCDAYLMSIIREVACAMEGDRKKRKMELTKEHNGISYAGPEFDFFLCNAMVAAFKLGELAHLDLPKAIVEKMEFNAMRSDHKIENRLKDGGKDY